MSDDTLDTSPTITPAPVEHPEANGSKRRRGPDPRAGNAMKHGLFAGKALKGLRDAPRRKAQRQVRDAMRGTGAEGQPFAEITGDVMRTLLEVKHRAERGLDRRGWTDSKGGMKSSVHTLVDVCDRLLGEARRLFERFGGTAPNVDSLATLVLAGMSDDERAAIGAGFPVEPINASRAAAASQSDAAPVTDAPPLPDAPRVSTAHGGAETWSDDDEPDDDFAKPDPFEALPSPTTKAAPAPVAARPSTPTPTRSKYTPGRDGPATSGRWQPLDGRESAESFDDD